jgi:hypothetical protein
MNLPQDDKDSDFFLDPSQFWKPEEMRSLTNEKNTKLGVLPQLQFYLTLELPPMPNVLASNYTAPSESY